MTSSATGPGALSDLLPTTSSARPHRVRLTSGVAKSAVTSVAAAPDASGSAPLCWLGRCVAVVRFGGRCTAREALEGLELCSSALGVREQVVVDLRGVIELSAAAAALLTRGARRFRGRVLLLAHDDVRERLAVIGGCTDLVHWSELTDEERDDLNADTDRDR